jgi:hypothetical protein
MKNVAIVILLAVLVGAALYAVTTKGRIMADTAIYLATSPSGEAAKELPAGTEAVVKRCIDTKHYIVPEIVDEQGKSWFVVGGRFHFVDHRRPWGC